MNKDEIIELHYTSRKVAMMYGVITDLLGLKYSKEQIDNMYPQKINPVYKVEHVSIQHGIIDDLVGIVKRDLKELELYEREEDNKND